MFNSICSSKFEIRDLIGVILTQETYMKKIDMEAFTRAALMYEYHVASGFRYCLMDGPSVKAEYLWYNSRGEPMGFGVRALELAQDIHGFIKLSEFVYQSRNKSFK